MGPSVKLGNSLCLSLTSLNPSPSLGASSAGQLLGDGRDQDKQASVTGLPPARELGSESPRGSCFSQGKGWGRGE